MRRGESYEYVNEAAISGTLTCAICLAPLRRPRVNSCQHMFCRVCIHDWMNNGGRSCPTCRQPLSELTSADASVKSRLARLPVKCNACGETGIRRDDFDDHKRYVCSEVQIICLARDLNCPWEGPRGQLNAHLNGCFYHRMRPTLEGLTLRNEQLTEELTLVRDENYDLRNEARVIRSKSTAY